MRRFFASVLIVAGLFVTACGGEAGVSHALASRQALTGAPEMVEFEAPTSRLQMFREMAMWSQLEAGRPATPDALFPIVQDGAVVCAPGLDARADLLQAPDSGNPLDLVLDGLGERWPQDRREGLQGLSEREAAEYIARSLLSSWAIHPAGAVQVDRAAGAPYAAAYVNGILRINPAFISMAAAASAASTPSTNQ
jgi:hypothetical protein